MINCIFDHGTGEMADFIAIQEKEYEVNVELFHVKKKSSKGYNSSVGEWTGGLVGCDVL